VEVSVLTVVTVYREVVYDVEVRVEVDVATTVVVVVLLVVEGWIVTSIRILEVPAGTLPEFEPELEPAEAVTVIRSPGPVAEIVTAYLPVESELV